MSRQRKERHPLDLIPPFKDRDEDRAATLAAAAAADAATLSPMNILQGLIYWAEGGIRSEADLAALVAAAKRHGLTS